MLNNYLKICKKRNMSFFKKVFCLMMVAILIFNTSSVLATSSISDINLGEYRVYSNLDDKMYIIYNGNTQYNYEYYYLSENNEVIPAYCLNLGVDGPENFDNYYVNVSEKLNDKIALNILLNGYPYKTVEELGVNTYSQARYCTQFALWVYLSNLDINKIVPTKTEYNCVVEGIKNIYYNGIKGENDLNNQFLLEAKDFKVFDKDNNYFFSDINLDFNENVLDYSMNITGVNEYKFIDKSTGKEVDIKKQKDVKSFYMLVPREDILENKQVRIDIEYTCKQTSIMFGVAKVAGNQNLALIDNRTVLARNTSSNVDINYVEQTLCIKKVDKDNNFISIPNVKFKIYSQIGKELGEYTTDENGIIKVDFLKEFNIKAGENVIIEEISVPSDYYLDTQNNKKSIVLEYDKINEVVFENERINAKINIIKKSEDYNPYNGLNANSLLEGCKFNIYDSNMNFIESVTTNKDGVAFTSKLYKGKYYIKEVETCKYYILNDKIYECYITNQNGDVNLTIYNKSMEKELPKTGF